MAPFDRSYTTFCQLSVCYCKYSTILYHFRDIWRWRISRPWNPIKGHKPCEFMHISEIYRPEAIFLPLICGSVSIHLCTASHRKKNSRVRWWVTIVQGHPILVWSPRNSGFPGICGIKIPIQKLESLGYPVVKTARSYRAFVFTCVSLWRTDRRCRPCRNRALA